MCSVLVIEGMADRMLGSVTDCVPPQHGVTFLFRIILAFISVITIYRFPWLQLSAII